MEEGEGVGFVFNDFVGGGGRFVKESLGKVNVSIVASSQNNGGLAYKFMKSMRILFICTLSCSL